MFDIETKHIEDVDELLAKVKDTIEYYKQLAEEATKKASLTEEEVKNKITNKWDSENKQIKDSLRYCIAKVYSEKELEAYYKFADKHKHIGYYPSKYDGSKIPYIKQHGVGIGVITEVYCDICGKHEDITDTSVW